MSLGSKKLNKAQAKAQEYVQKHKVEKLISEMVNSLVHTRDKKPIIYMIKYLANYCTQEDLEENGIKVEGPLPQRIPLMNYPEFTEDCTSLLKAHLTKEIWSAMKKRATHLGGKIQLCVQCGVYDEKDDIGIYATDEEAYKVFDDLFTPIVQDLHPDYDIKANYRNEFELVSITNLQKLAKLKNKISFVQVSARRNFKDYPFTPMMSTQIKFQVEKKIIETLGEMYGQYHQLAKISEETKTWLTSMGIDISKQASHDAAGINEDWPSGRGVFIDENNAFVILVNFEDHFQVFTMNNDGDFNKSLTSLLRVLSKFEKVGYARHTSLGFLTASPKNLGTTLKIGCKIMLKEHRSSDDLESFEGTYSCKINEIQGGRNEYEITYLKTLAKNLSENDAINEFSEWLLRLTEKEIEEDHQEEQEVGVDQVINNESSKTEAAKPAPTEEPVSKKEENKEKSKDEKGQAEASKDDKKEESVPQTTKEAEEVEPEKEPKNSEASKIEDQVKEEDKEASSEPKTEEAPKEEPKEPEVAKEEPAAEAKEEPKQASDAPNEDNKEIKPPAEEPKEDKEDE